MGKIVTIMGKEFTVPEWAKYRAIDADGDGYVYSFPPRLRDSLGAWLYEQAIPDSFYIWVGRFDLDGIDWRDTLEELTEQEAEIMTRNTEAVEPMKLGKLIEQRDALMRIQLKLQANLNAPIDDVRIRISHRGQDEISINATIEGADLYAEIIKVKQWLDREVDKHNSAIAAAEGAANAIING